MLYTMMIAGGIAPLGADPAPVETHGSRVRPTAPVQARPLPPARMPVR
jgi:hypothetical protein